MRYEVLDEKLGEAYELASDIEEYTYSRELKEATASVAHTMKFLQQPEKYDFEDAEQAIEYGLEGMSKAHTILRTIKIDPSEKAFPTLEEPLELAEETDGQVEKVVSNLAHVFLNNYEQLKQSSPEIEEYFESREGREFLFSSGLEKAVEMLDAEGDL